MHDPHAMLVVFTVVLGVAAATTVTFQRIHQPVVLGYILAGLIVGPHVPIPLVADRDAVHVVSELGVILLMFSLGLEFSIRRLLGVGATAAVTAVIQSSVMIWLGYAAGQAFGWTARECVFAGATIAISSTTIIAKAFDEQGVGGRLRELVVAILIVEDLIAILLMALLTALSSGDGVSAASIGWSSARLAGFLVALVVVGLLLVPRTIRAITRLQRAETTLVASLGLCFAIALLAHEFGYSVALGAFVAGSLIAESGEAHDIEELVRPVRDMFAAIFFVSVGMSIDPGVIAGHWAAVAVFTAVVIVGKVVGVSLGAFLTGNGIRTSVAAGMSLAQIGEFSFIIAALGTSLGATGDFLYPVAVAVSAMTTLTTPWLIRAAGPAATWIDRRLPRPLQTFAALYGTWIEQLATTSQARSATARAVRLLLADVAVLTAVVVAAALSADAVADAASRHLDVSPRFAHVGVAVAALACATPCLVGLLRVSRWLGTLLAQSAMPHVPDGAVDFAAAPRRALVVTLQLAVVLVIGLPLVAVVQPFVPGWPAPAVLAMLLVVLGVAFWRSATDLQGHVRAGAAMIADALLAHAARPGTPGDGDPAADGNVLAEARRLMPGIGEPVPLRLDGDAAAVGTTLAQLNLRGVTGASVLAIVRRDGSGMVPAATDVLRAGDVLVLAGTHAAVDAAIALLRDGAPAMDAP